MTITTRRQISKVESLGTITSMAIDSNIIVQKY